MKLWLLEWVDEPHGWDTARGFVIVAPDEATARALAQENGGDETYAPDFGNRTAFWLSPKLASCVPLSAELFTEAQVILRNYNAG